MRIRVRIGFAARLMLALVATLCITGALAFLLTAPRTRQTFVDAAAREHRSDAFAVEHAYWSASVDRSPMREVDRVLRLLAQRPDVRHVLLINPRQHVEAASEPAALDRLVPTAQMPRRRGAGTDARIEETADGRVLALLTPLVLGGQRYVLRSEESTAPLDRAQAGARRSALLSPLLGLLVGIPVFFLLGGRALGRMHRSALQRARVDGLTELYNHRAFQDELDSAGATSTRTAEPLTLAVMDVDDFKLANDHHGHTHGDQVLCGLAGLLGATRSADRAFRIGGDEFALLMPETGIEGAQRVLERLRGRASATGIRLSVGVAQFVPGPDGAEELWERADGALYEAKRSGGDAVAIAPLAAGRDAPGQRRRALHELLVHGAVESALQPIWDLDGERVLGYEALARPAADSGFAGPWELFDAAERTAKSRELDDLCRAAALARAAEIGPEELLFINLAPQSLEHLRVDALVAEVRAAGLEPARIALEISERPMARQRRTVEQAGRLRAAGFRLALDDVGTGNADLGLLRALALDYVKIDRDVVATAMGDRRARSVLAAILAFAGQSETYVIAEGLEDEPMLEFVRGLSAAGELPIARIRGGQGYLLGRPTLEPVRAVLAAT